MDLRTSRLVAFVIIMDASAGIMSKGPETVTEEWDTLECCTTFEALCEVIGPTWVHVLENYLSNWEIPEEPRAPEGLEEPPLKTAVDEDKAFEEAERHWNQLQGGGGERQEIRPEDVRSIDDVLKGGMGDLPPPLTNEPKPKRRGK